MATAKKTTTKRTSVRKVDSSKASTSQKVSAPKRTTRKKETSEMNTMEMDSRESSPKSRVITRKYLYAVAGVVVLIGLLFIASRFWVIAWVDNKPVTKFELYSLLEKRDQGKTQEELITQKLLESEGQKQRQSVSDAEVQAEVKKVEEQQGGAEQLKQVLAANGTTYEEFQKLVKRQLLIQKLFGGGINITDADVEKYMSDNKDALPPAVLENPESSEAAKLKDSVREQLKWGKISENYQKWIQENLNGSRVRKV
jgi:hypothetical protein